MWWIGISSSFTYLSGTDDYVVDWNKDELHKEANESHHNEPNRCTNSNFREFYKKPQNQNHRQKAKHTDLARYHSWRIKSMVPLRSGLWQRLTRRMLSLAKSLRGSTTESMASMALLSMISQSQSHSSFCASFERNVTEFLMTNHNAKNNNRWT